MLAFALGVAVGAVASVVSTKVYAFVKSKVTKVEAAVTSKV